MQLSRELLLAKRQQATDERDRHLAGLNVQIGRIAAIDDLLAVLELPDQPKPADSNREK